MIDKRIYYCWFGHGEMTQLNKKCIASWKYFCPDYELVELNEDNFDHTISEYAIEGYEKKNWSAVSNTARLEILRTGNGFYLDTDVQLLKSLDEIRDLDAGFITEFDVGEPDSGVLGCGEGFPWLYDVAAKELTKGTVLHKNFIRNMYQKYDYHGESKITYDDGFTILGEEWFPTVRSGFITENTIAIHYFENTWTRYPIKIIDPFYPFQKVRVFIRGKKVYEDKDATVDLYVLNGKKSWKGPEILGRANYLFNPNVISVQTRDFIAKRIDFDIYESCPIHTLITEGGVVVKYKGDRNE